MELEKLIKGYFEGELTEEEKHELNSAIRQDSGAKELFRQWKQVYDLEFEAGANTGYDLEKQWKTVSEKLQAEFSKSAGIFRINQLLKYAAVLIFGLIAGFAVYQVQKSQKTEQVVENEIIVPRGQKSQLTLSDGTKIWLNSETRLKYPSTFGLSGTRRVSLEGEAYFEVGHNENMPFIVQTGNLDIKVLGTSFNVKTYPDDKTVETTLIEGKVSLEKIVNGNQAENIMLSPNQKGIYNKTNQHIVVEDLEKETSGSGPTAKKHVNVQGSPAQKTISWKEEVLEFDNESLAEMARKLERWYGYNVVIEDPELFKHRYKGRFENLEPISRVLDVVKITTPLKYKIENRTVTISKQ